MANQDIKSEAKKAGVKLWQIAEAIGISDVTLSRRLRHEFKLAEKERVRAAIAELSRERDAV